MATSLPSASPPLESAPLPLAGRGRLRALAACSAMLLLPLVAWLALPAPGAGRGGPRAGRPAAPAEVPGEAAEEDPEAPSRFGRIARHFAEGAPFVPEDPEPAPAEEAPRAATLAGRVLGPSGEGIEGASVRCEDRAQLAATSGKEGAFELPPEAEGCLLVALKAGFSASEAKRLEAAGATLELGALGGISGVVVDERGAPVPAFSVTIERAIVRRAPGEPRGPGRQPSRFEGTAGAFSLPDLEAGRYVLSVSAEGRPAARSEPVEVEAGRTTGRIRIAIPRGARLLGLVTDAVTGAPVEGASVSLDAALPGGAAPATTDASGRFELTGIPPGPFSVRIAREGYTTKIASGLDARGARIAREGFRLSAGEGKSELTGIGARLSASSEGLVVAGLVAGGPAESSGLLAKDVVVAIDGKSARDLTVSEGVQLLRGPAGSRVSITVARGEGAVRSENTVVVRRDRVVH